MNGIENVTQDRRAAIVCSHVADERVPILRAVRDEPAIPEDSGWQFLCGSVHTQDPAAAKVWLICEVLQFETSLSDFIGRPPGTILTRKDAASAWEL
jgi:hypothetical protein